MIYTPAPATARPRVVRPGGTGPELLPSGATAGPRRWVPLLARVSAAPPAVPAHWTAHPPPARCGEEVVVAGLTAPVPGSGDGWRTCAAGHRHWGRFGAAGLLVATPTVMLLQLRAASTHHGGTWSVPGGARERHENAVTAALREAGEELDIAVHGVSVWDTDVDDHGGWSYTTVLARPRGELSFRWNQETAAVRWVPLPEVAELPLHPGFRASWPRLRRRLSSPGLRDQVGAGSDGR